MRALHCTVIQPINLALCRALRITCQICQRACSRLERLLLQHEPTWLSATVFDLRRTLIIKTQYVLSGPCSPTA